jgi:glucose-1-phosphate thymidylyltransferase
MFCDNNLSGADDFLHAVSGFADGPTIFAGHVKDAERNGVVEFDRNVKTISIEGMPQQPKSYYAAPSVYLYDNEVLATAKVVKSSALDALKIMDVNLKHLRRDRLQMRRFSRCFALLDAGFSTARHEASSCVEGIKPQTIKTAFSKVAVRMIGAFSIERVEVLTERMPTCEYSEFRSGVADERDWLKEEKQ